jgi:hypothetical protein
MDSTLVLVPAREGRWSYGGLVRPMHDLQRQYSDCGSGTNEIGQPTPPQHHVDIPHYDLTLTSFAIQFTHRYSQSSKQSLEYREGVEYRHRHH